MAEGLETGDLLDGAPCGFCVFADDGTILTANATLRDWLGYGPEGIEGLRIEALLSAGGRVFYQTHLFPLLKLHGKADEVYLSLRSTGGGEVPVLVSAVRRERDGAAVNECAFLPMRRRSRYEDEILQAKKDAEQAIQEKSRAYDALSRAQAELGERQRELLAANARLRSRAEREALLNRIGQTIRTAATPGQVLETAVRELGEALGADRSYYAAYDRDADLAAAGPEWHRAGLTPHSGHYAMAGLAADRADDTSGRTQIVPDTWDDPNAERLGPRALLRVPLLTGTAVTALSVAMTDGPRDWTPDEIALVEAVATQTQSAMEAVRVRRREHNIAEQLQAALQPPLPEGVAGLRMAKHYEAALEEAGVGGDFYDVFPIEKGCTVLAVGDLSGKGLQAAAQVATVRNMLRAFLYSKPSLAEAATDLNRVIALNRLISGFATLFVGCYDAATGDLTYVNMGQEPALVRRAVTGVVEQLMPTGPVLGAAENAVYREETLRLSPGDTLMVFTDGVTECGVSRREMLGIPGVIELLDPPFTAEQSGSPERLAEAVTLRLVSGVDAVSRGGVAKDDVCILVAVVEGDYSTE